MIVSTLLAVLAVGAHLSFADDLPPSCNRPVYCNSSLLHHVQMGKVFPSDSKTFVDLQMKTDETTTLNAFQELLDKNNGNLTTEQLTAFVDEYFNATSELEYWTPTDYSNDPLFLNEIADKDLKQFAKDVQAIWPTLGRKVKSIVFEKPEQFSFIPVPNGFIIPGGRFKELYYWDTYWILEGLLIAQMNTTAKGVIENLLELLRQVGHIPNGSRWYYQERSQPPLLTAMVALYLKYTEDTEFLRKNIKNLEKEVEYWMNTQIVAIEKDGREHTLLQYYAPSHGPRPESYREDYENAQQFSKSKERQTEFYIDVKSAAESGWDFSTRWFIDSKGGNNGSLTVIHTKDIVPVDLNAIYANALQNLADFHVKLGNTRRAAHWGYFARQWRSSIEDVFWDEDDGIWYDYDLSNKKHRKYFYASNVAPLWMGAVDKRLVKFHGPRIVEYLAESHGLDYPGGVPTSFIRSGEQWDFPNAWPPLVSIMVNSLEALGLPEANKMAFNVAQTWIRSNYKGFVENNQMFEKYDAEVPGRIGDGGEYVPQSGFGWSNGIVFEFLNKYGSTLTAADSAIATQNPSSEASVSKLENESSPSESPNENSSEEWVKVLPIVTRKAS